jgi:hypothetical protein
MANKLLTAFNTHFEEFVKDIQSVFPNDPDILAAQKSLSLIKQANPKLIVKIWKMNIGEKYCKEIEDGNIDFFINKKYDEDLGQIAGQSDFQRKIIEAIDRLRTPIKEMSKENQEKTMKYIQNLTKLSEMIV